MRTKAWMLVLALVVICIFLGCRRSEQPPAAKPGDPAAPAGFKPVAVKALEKTTVDCGNRVNMDLLLIPAGRFMMGSSEGTRSGPRHEVTLTKPFWLGLTEVTQAQYEAVMGKNPSYTKGPDHPVEFTSWRSAVKFCEKLSEKTGKKFRLPTEAEWEYAARAGTDTPWYWGNTPDQIGHYAVYKGNSQGLNVSGPVASKSPNPWGLYDVLGNVWELVWDNDSGGYSTSDAVDPTGNKVDVGIKVARGGSMNYDPDKCNATFRLAQNLDVTLFETGFRVACDKE